MLHCFFIFFFALMGESSAVECETVWLCRHDDCGCQHGLVRSQDEYELLLAQKNKIQLEHGCCQVCLQENLLKFPAIKETESFQLLPSQISFCDAKHVVLPYKYKSESARTVEYYLSLVDDSSSGFCCKGSLGRELGVYYDRALFQVSCRICTIKILSPKSIVPFIIKLQASLLNNNAAEIYAEGCYGAKKVLIAQIPYIPSLSTRSRLKFHQSGPTFSIEFSPDYELILKQNDSVWCCGLLVYLQAHGVRHYKQCFSLDSDETCVQRKIICERFMFPAKQEYPSLIMGGPPMVLNVLDHTVREGAYSQPFASIITENSFGLQHVWLMTWHVLGNTFFLGAESTILNYMSVLLRYKLKEPLCPANIFCKLGGEGKRIVWHFEKSDFSISLAPQNALDSTLEMLCLDKDRLVAKSSLNFRIMRQSIVKSNTQKWVYQMPKILINVSGSMYYMPHGRIILPQKDATLTSRVIVFETLGDGRAVLSYYPNLIKGSIPRQKIFLSANTVCRTRILSHISPSITQEGRWRIRWDLGEGESCVIQEEPTVDKTVRLKIIDTLDGKAVRQTLCHFSEDEVRYPPYTVIMVNVTERINLQWKHILSKGQERIMSVMSCSFGAEKIIFQRSRAEVWEYLLRFNITCHPGWREYSSNVYVRFIKRGAGYALEFKHEPKGEHVSLLKTKYMIELEDMPRTISRIWDPNDMASLIVNVVDVKKKSHRVCLNTFDDKHRFGQSLHFWYEGQEICGVNARCKRKHTKQSGSSKKLNNEK